MKQMRFLDNVRTPESWQRRALKAAESEESKPKLRRWQSAGIVAAAAVMVVGIVGVPALLGHRGIDTPVDSAVQDIHEAAGENREKLEKDRQKYIEESEAAMKEKFARTESVTVLDCELNEEEGVINLAGARQSYQFGNYIMCVEIPAEGDALTGSRELPEFGDKVVLGFDEIIGEDCVDANISLKINGRDYLGVQMKGLGKSKGYADLGRWDDALFGDIVRSAQAAARVSEDTFDDTVKRYVRGTYDNITNVKPDLSCGIKRGSAAAGLEISMMTTLFDDAYERGAATSQLYVMKIEKTNGEYLWADAGFDSVERTCSLTIDDIDGTLDISGDTEIDILNVRTAADDEKENVAYLLINAVDAERTGNIRGALNFDLVLNDVKESVDGAKENTVIQNAYVENREFDFTVEAAHDVVIRQFDDGGNKSTTFLYTFELTAPDGMDIGKAEDILITEPSKTPDMTLFRIGKNEYAVKAEGGEVKKLSVARLQTYGKDKLLMLLAVYREGLLDVSPENMTFRFGKKTGEDISWECKAVFGADEEYAENKYVETELLGYIISAQQAVDQIERDIDGKKYTVQYYSFVINKKNGESFNKYSVKKNSRNCLEVTLDGDTIYLMNCGPGDIIFSEDDPQEYEVSAESVMLTVPVKHDKAPDPAEDTAVFNFSENADKLNDNGYLMVFANRAEQSELSEESTAVR